MKLRRWILRTGRTAKGLAEELSVTSQYIALLMKGQRKPSKELMDKIREITEGKVKYLSHIRDEKQEKL